jgi:hypothetical protein
MDHTSDQPRAILKLMPQKTLSEIGCAVVQLNDCASRGAPRDDSKQRRRDGMIVYPRINDGTKVGYMVEVWVHAKTASLSRCRKAVGYQFLSRLCFDSGPLDDAGARYLYSVTN